VHEEEDDALGPRREMGWPGRERIGGRGGGPRLRFGQQTGERHAAEADAALAEHLATGQSAVGIPVFVHQYVLSTRPIPAWKDAERLAVFSKVFECAIHDATDFRLYSRDCPLFFRQHHPTKRDCLSDCLLNGMWSHKIPTFLEVFGIIAALGKHHV